ncbi:MAG: ADP-heptose:LPS heptosyltransferase [Planctomycetota bacterium]|jgi:ADP-heptose:LPS heptosyltransferase
MTRILVIRRGGLGDTLLTAPLLRALRRQHEGAQVHLAGTREFCDVLCAYGIVDAAHSAEDFLLWIPDRARQRLASFDLVIGDEPDCVQHAFDLKGHVSGTSYALQLARQISCEPEWPADCQLLPSRASASSGSMVFAPGSGGAEKCWPQEYWLALAQRLHGQGHELQVVIGPVEMERDDPRVWSWPSDTTFVVEQEPVQLAKVLESARAFIGNDSGTTHLAAMLALPTVAIFVATDASVWAPVGDHVQVVGSVGHLPNVDTVANAAALAWGG